MTLAFLKRTDVDTLCATLPGAELALPPDALTSWKVGGKMFACMAGNRDDGVSVKCPDVETAAMLIDAGAAEKAAYFHRSWVRLPYATTAVAEAEHRIRVSYDTIRATLPKAKREAL